MVGNHAWLVSYGVHGPRSFFEGGMLQFSEVHVILYWMKYLIANFSFPNNTASEKVGFIYFVIANIIWLSKLCTSLNELKCG